LKARLPMLRYAHFQEPGLCQSTVSQAK
jgi:hypothetical protein